MISFVSYLKYETIAPYKKTDKWYQLNDIRWFIIICSYIVSDISRFCRVTTETGTLKFRFYHKIGISSLCVCVCVCEGGGSNTRLHPLPPMYALNLVNIFAHPHAENMYTRIERLYEIYYKMYRDLLELPNKFQKNESR
jgi:hypothetical protein